MRLGVVRALEVGDVPAVAALRRRCFRHTQHADDAALSRRLRAIFLESPLRDGRIQSLVCEDDRGRVVGFRGLLPRPLRFRGEPLVAAVSSQLMVDPDARTAGVAFALMRATVAQPLDLLFSDLANPGAVAIWKAMRGQEIPELGLHWTRPVRPLGWMAARVGRGAAGSRSRRLTTPLIRLLDRFVGVDAWRAFGERAQRGALATKDLTLGMQLTSIGRLEERYDLVPAYDEASLRWTLERTREGLDDGERLVSKCVVDANGVEQGFYVMAVRANASAQVLQLAGSAAVDDLLACAFDDASEAECLDLSGRMQPGLLNELGRPPACVLVGPPRFLAWSRRSEILDCIRSGRAWFSRLDGEWWMGF